MADAFALGRPHLRQIDPQITRPRPHRRGSEDGFRLFLVLLRKQEPRVIGVAFRILGSCFRRSTARHFARGLVLPHLRISRPYCLYLLTALLVLASGPHVPPGTHPHPPHPHPTLLAQPARTLRHS